MKLFKILFLLILPFFLFTLSACDNTRKFEITDIEYESEFTNLNTSFIVRVKPKYDIPKLDITFTLLDKNGKGIYQETISKSELHRNGEYIYTLNYSLLSSLNAERVEYDFSGITDDIYTANKNREETAKKILQSTLQMILPFLILLLFFYFLYKLQKKLDSEKQ